MKFDDPILGDALGDFDPDEFTERCETPTSDEMPLRVSLIMGQAVLDLIRNKKPVNELSILKAIQDSVGYEEFDDGDGDYSCTHSGNFGIEHEVTMDILKNFKH